MKGEVTINGETFRRLTYTNVRGGTTHYWQSDRRQVSSQKFAAIQRESRKGGKVSGRLAGSSGAAASALTRPPSSIESTHGGRRDGAGRPPLEGGRVTRCYAMTLGHVDILDQYRQQHQLGSASEALRHLIESCAT